MANNNTKTYVDEERLQQYVDAVIKAYKAANPSWTEEELNNHLQHNVYDKINEVTNEINEINTEINKYQDKLDQLPENATERLSTAENQIVILNADKDKLTDDIQRITTKYDTINGKQTEIETYSRQIGEDFQTFKSQHENKSYVEDYDFDKFKTSVHESNATLTTEIETTKGNITKLNTEVKQHYVTKEESKDFATKEQVQAIEESTSTILSEQNSIIDILTGTMKITAEDHAKLSTEVTEFKENYTYKYDELNNSHTNLVSRVDTEFVPKSSVKFDKTSQELTISDVKVPLSSVTINAEGVVEEVENVIKYVDDAIPAIADALQPIKIIGDDWIEVEETPSESTYAATYFKTGTTSDARQQALDKIRNMNTKPDVCLKIKSLIIEKINSGLSSINDIESALSKKGYTMSDFITKTEELSELSAKSQELASECSSWWDKCKNVLDKVTPDLSTLKNTVDTITPDLSTLKNTVDAITPDLSTISAYSISAYDMAISALDKVTPDLSTLSDAILNTTLSNAIDAITPDLSTISAYSISAYDMAISVLDKVTPDLSTLSNAILNTTLSDVFDAITPDLSTISAYSISAYDMAISVLDKVTPDLSTISSYSISAYNMAISALDKVTPDLSTLSNAIDTITPDLSTLSNAIDAITPDLSTISAYSISAYDMAISVLDKVTPDLSTLSNAIDAITPDLSTLSNAILNTTLLDVFDAITPDLSTLSNAIDAITPDLSTISAYSISAYDMTISVLDKVTPDLSTLSNAIDAITPDLSTLSNAIDAITPDLSRLSSDTSATIYVNDTEYKLTLSKQHLIFKNSDTIDISANTDASGNLVLQFHAHYSYSNN